MEILRAFGEIRPGEDAWSPVTLAREMRAEVALGIQDQDTAKSATEAENSKAVMERETPGRVSGALANELLRACDVVEGREEG